MKWMLKSLTGLTPCRGEKKVGLRVKGFAVAGSPVNSVRPFMSMRKGRILAGRSGAAKGMPCKAICRQPQHPLSLRQLRRSLRRSHLRLPASHPSRLTLCRLMGLPFLRSAPAGLWESGFRGFAVERECKVLVGDGPKFPVLARGMSVLRLWDSCIFWAWMLGVLFGCMEFQNCWQRPSYCVNFPWGAITLCVNF